MMKIIDGAVLNKYRTPGAHSGALPYSVACEAKEYVKKQYPKNKIFDSFVKKIKKNKD